MKQKVQNVSWGSIDWIVEPTIGSNSNMSIGIMNIEPGKFQAEHVHFSDEQFLYTISGIGEHYINGECCSLSAGDYFHCPPGVFHATHNHGDSVLKIIIVSVPLNLKDCFVKPLSDYGFETASIPDNVIEMYLIDIVMALRDQLFSTLSVPITVFSNKFIPLLSGQLPQACQEHCHTDSSHSICPIAFEHAKSRGFGKESCSTIVCPYGLTVLLQTIMVDNRLIGYIQAGHCTNFSEMPNTTVKALYEILAEISVGLQRYCIEKILQSSFNKQQVDYKKTNRRNLALNYALENMQDRMLHVQIKNHFLFNTLNSIASIALRDGSKDTYSAILDLSNLLDGLMHEEGSLIPLSDEMKNLEKYINLQKLRYGKDLYVEFNRDPNAENAIVPFQCLQPIVENCFKHGFKDFIGQKQILISNILLDNTVSISIQDNGCGISDSKRIDIEKYMKTNKHHGISMVNHLLQRSFGAQYKFLIKKSDGEGTTIQIDIPSNIDFKTTKGAIKC